MKVHYQVQTNSKTLKGEEVQLEVQFEKKLKPLPKKDYALLPPYFFEAFSRIYYMMQPENLSCDGELSRRQIARRKARLKEEWRLLEQQLGYKVSFNSFEDEFYRRLEG
ncbi:hypothetical protein ACPVTF_15320 [Geobacillus icigianus]|uniref:hypothetical protein n=1 Tax=Geobacillus TaxID=129337 RepID=UPI0011322827|nr:hypothetical protein [Geobacillus thermocatenulatus]